MLGRLFAETMEQMDMAPIEALTLTARGAPRSSPMGSSRRSCRLAKVRS
jgi:hypothetical protein